MLTIVPAKRTSAHSSRGSVPRRKPASAEKALREWFIICDGVRQAVRFAGFRRDTRTVRQAIARTASVRRFRVDRQGRTAEFTMILKRILKPENVLCNVSARGKKHCLEILSELLAKGSIAVPHEEIFAKLVERERLGCTALGGGVALPHCRFDGIEETTAALLKMAQAVDFESPDDRPVDLVFGMMVPEEITDSHRDDIATISEALKDASVQSRLRRARSASELYQAFISGYGRPDAGIVPEPRKRSRGP